MDVTSWLLQNSARLASRRPDDWRLLQPGTYSHRTLKYGASRSGITDGVIAMLATDSHGVVEVQLASLDVKLDSTAVFRGRKPRTATARKTVGTASRRAALSALINDLSRLL